jgi:transcription initiation factor TFIID subunit 2
LQFTDSYYIASVINSLANTFISLAVTEGSDFFTSRHADPLSDTKLRLAVDEIERYMSMDRLVPSYHNVITLAGLEVSFFLNGSACML